MKANNSRILFRLIVSLKRKLRKRKRVILSTRENIIKMRITSSLSLPERMKGSKCRISRTMLTLWQLPFSRLLLRRPLMARNL